MFNVKVEKKWKTLYFSVTPVLVLVLSLAISFKVQQMSLIFVKPPPQKKKSCYTELIFVKQEKNKKTCYTIKGTKVKKEISKIPLTLC